MLPEFSCNRVWAWPILWSTHTGFRIIANSFGFVKSRIISVLTIYLSGKSRLCMVFCSVITIVTLKTNSFKLQEKNAHFVQHLLEDHTSKACYGIGSTSPQANSLGDPCAPCHRTFYGKCTTDCSNPKSPHDWITSIAILRYYAFSHFSFIIHIETIHAAAQPKNIVNF